MKRILPLLLVAAFTACASTPKESSEIGRFVDQVLRDNPEAPTLGVIVVKDGRTAYVHEPQTAYYIGSTTKAYTGLACAMLLYANERLGPVVFASVVAICSKCVLRVPAERGTRHFLNPSNFGISMTLLTFAWVSVAPPYQFTENMTGFGDWVLPAVIVCTGTFLNARFTHRLPLIAAWLGGFVAQAALRSFVFDTPLTAALMPMTGVAFILYTFYMVTDPATTPTARRDQIGFGLSVAAVYGVLMAVHVVFGMFFALTIVCTCRGLCAYAVRWLRSRAGEEGVAAPASAIVREA